MSARAAIVLVLAIAGCQPAPSLTGLSLRPAPNGLAVDGSGGREIGFGRAQAGALAAIARVEGRVPRAVPCGGGREAFAADGGLRVVFEAGRFVGWESEAGAAGRTCGA